MVERGSGMYKLQTIHPDHKCFLVLIVYLLCDFMKMVQGNLSKCFESFAVFQVQVANCAGVRFTL